MKRTGFTLVEVLTVITIIGILVSIGSYVYTNALVRSRDNQRIADLQFIRNGLEQFYFDNRSYPTFDTRVTNMPQATWQLEAGFNCQTAGKRFLTPKYLANIPQDPSRPFINPASGSCPATSSFGQYLYFGLPLADSKQGYRLMARMERIQNVNYTSILSNDLSSGGYSSSSLPSFCATVTPVCSQNYFVSSSKNN